MKPLLFLPLPITALLSPHQRSSPSSWIAKPSTSTSSTRRYANLRDFVGFPSDNRPSFTNTYRPPRDNFIDTTRRDVYNSGGGSNRYYNSNNNNGNYAFNPFVEEYDRNYVTRDGRLDGGPRGSGGGRRRYDDYEDGRGEYLQRWVLFLCHISTYVWFLK